MPRYIDATEVIQKENIDVDYLPNRRLSDDTVIIEVNRKSFKYAFIVIPSNFKNNVVFKAILSGFLVPWYAIELGSSARDQVNDSVINFFNHAKKMDSLGLRNISVNDALTDWKNYLIKNNSGYDSWKQLSELLKMFRKSLNYHFGKTSCWPDELKDSFFLLKSITPIKPRHQKKPTIGLYLGIPQENFSNSELLMGLRYGCLWMLQKIDFLKSNILKGDAVKSELDKIKGLKLNEVKNFFLNKNEHYFNRNKHSDSERVDSISSIWRTIQVEPLLKEWQFYTSPRLINPVRLNICSPFNESIQSILINRHLDSNGNVRPSIIGYGKFDNEWTPLKKYLGPAGRCAALHLPCIWGLDLLKHTYLENLLMVWLLSSERVQLSGIESLRLSSFVFTENNRSLQITSIKSRRNTPNKSGVKSQIYRRSDPPFKAYQAWHSKEVELMENISDYNLRGLYIPHACGALTGKISVKNQDNFPKALLPLELIATPGTIWNQAFLHEVPETGLPEANAFIKIIEALISRNRKTMGRNLPTSIINQSVVVAQQQKSKIQGKMDLVEAETMGHTLSVNKNVYQKGFRELDVREICEPVRHFARSVGDEKYLFALQIANRLSESTRKIKLSELKEILNFTDSYSDSNNLISTLSESDMLLIDGEIKCGEELLIVQTDMTAALMHGYMKHIEKSLPVLMQSSRHEATIRYLAKFIHLFQVLHSFPKRLQAEGKELADQLDFKFPSLL